MDGLRARLQPLADQVESGAQRVWSDNHGDAVEAFKAKWSAGDAPLASLKDSITGAEMVGPLLMVAAGVVLALKIDVIVQLTTLAIEIAEALATAVPTFGASLFEIPVFKEITNRLMDLVINLAMEAILGLRRGDAPPRRSSTRLPRKKRTSSGRRATGSSAR